MRSTLVSICVVLLVICFSSSAMAMLTINTGPFANVSIPTAQFYWKGDDINMVFDTVTAELADSTMTNLTGKIVFQKFLAVGNWLQAILNIQEAGAIAVIYGTESIVSGQYGCALTGARPTGTVKIPVAEIATVRFAQIRQALLNGSITDVEVTLSSEGNPWNNILGGIPVIIVFRVIYTAAAVGLIGFALYKLVMFVRRQGHQFNVPQVCLGLEIVANLIRIAYFAVDPFSCFGYYGDALSFLTTLSLPYEVSTFVLITFYWFEAVNNASLSVYPFLHRLRPVFFAFTIGFIILMLLLSVLGYVIALPITLPVIIVYLIVSVAFLIFYIVTVVKIVRKMAKSQTMRQKKKQILEEINTKIIINGVIRVCTLIPILVFSVPTISSVPEPHYIGSVFIYAMVLLDSWARIYLFREPTKAKSSATGTGKSQKTGTNTNSQKTGTNTNSHKTSSPRDEAELANSQTALTNTEN